MDKRKPIDKLSLGRFWKNAEAWILANLQALFENDEEIVQSIDQIKEDVNSIKEADGEYVESEPTDDVAESTEESIKDYIDRFIEEGGDATDAQVLKNTADISELNTKITKKQTILSELAINTIKTILEEGVYSSDQSANINIFISELRKAQITDEENTGGGTETPDASYCRYDELSRHG